MQTAAQLMPINDPSKFDAKMGALTKLCAPFQADAIEGLKDTFLADAPGLHQNSLRLAEMEWIALDGHLKTGHLCTNGTWPAWHPRVLC
jgi:hypothetical protein